MALPVNALLHPVSTVVLEEQHPSRAPLLDYIYRVSLHLGLRAYLSENYHNVFCALTYLSMPFEKDLWWAEHLKRNEQLNE
jgi:hypothetical protein